MLRATALQAGSATSQDLRISGSQDLRIQDLRYQDLRYQDLRIQDLRYQDLRISGSQDLRVSAARGDRCAEGPARAWSAGRTPKVHVSGYIARIPNVLPSRTLLLGSTLPYTPGTPLPYHPCTYMAGYAWQGPAQRLAHSVKTSNTGSPTYHPTIRPTIRPTDRPTDRPSDHPSYLSYTSVIPQLYLS